MDELEKKWKNKEVDNIELEEEKEEKEIRVNWPRIAFLGFITSLAFVIIDVIIGLILYFGFSQDMLYILYFMQYFTFGEAGLVIFLGACIGNFGQSVVVSNLKEKIVGSDPISKDSIREATFNAFTYYFAGVLLLLYTTIMWRILTLIYS
ncbi:MAG: hypothetical protein HGN29_01120 [Asgard group archaeon]|nr:hypothetical protein [Asgard group archaeon]